MLCCICNKDSAEDENLCLKCYIAFKHIQNQDDLMSLVNCYQHYLDEINITNISDELKANIEERKNKFENKIKLQCEKILNDEQFVSLDNFQLITKQFGCSNKKEIHDIINKYYYKKGEKQTNANI